MTTNREQKIKRLLGEHKSGTVCLSAWLEGLGISHDLQKHYRKSGWLESIGTGAFKRPGDTLDWPGALHALQVQALMPVHAGAVTALSLQGLGHYIRATGETVFLFSPPGVTLPAWFKRQDWSITHVATGFLGEGAGLVSHEMKTFDILVSTPERALLECLYLVPGRMDMIECYHLLEGLANLRPKLLQELLEGCTSVKVKRLFLYMAKKAGHQWLKFLDPARINLGKGTRSLAKGGVYDSEFQLMLPKELVES